MDKTQTLQVIISASIGGGFSLLTLLITLFYFRNKNRLEEEMLLQKIYSESPLSYIINKKEKSKYKKKESVTPNYYDIRFKEEEQIFLKQWNSMTKDRALDSDSKSKIMNEKGEEYTAMADMAWNSLDKGGRYHSAFLYILAAECYQLTGNYSRAGSLYHYGAMLLRLLGELDRSAGWYYVAALCHLKVNSENEQKKARRSLSRSLGAYNEGGNIEGAERAKERYLEVIKALKNNFNWDYVIDEEVEFKKIESMK